MAQIIGIALGDLWPAVDQDQLAAQPFQGDGVSQGTADAANANDGNFHNIILDELAGRFSLGRGKYGDSSLDLLILGDEPLPLAVRVELNEAFCESDLPYRVDIVEWARASPEFRERIQHCHVVVQPACLSTGRSRPN